MKLTKPIFALAAAYALAFCQLSWSQTEKNSIESLQYSLQGGELLIKVQMKSPLAAPPTGFAVSNPARIALDFPATENGFGKTSEPVNQGDLTSVNVIQVGDRTRLVLNLLRAQPYTMRTEGNQLLIVLSNGPTTAIGTPSSSRFAEESAVGKKHSIRDIAFRRGKDGEARILIDLSDAGTGIDIRQQGASLIVDFLKTNAPDNLRRKLDVTDFATPVTGISTSAQGDNVRMTITPKGLWEHNAYQTDNQFVIEVKPIIENPNKLVQGSKLGYQGPRVSINYQNGEIRALLRLMAEELGLNAVISETVTGTTTLVLKDVPADQVIDLIFKQKGLDMRKNGNVLLIAPRDELSQREKLEFEAQLQLNDLEPLRMETIQLNYQKAADIAKLLMATSGGGSATGGGHRLLSKRGSVTSDPVTNNVFVNDIASKIEEVRKFIKTIDIGSRQVMIEARVVEASDNFAKDLGVRLGYAHGGRAQIGGSGVYIGGGSFVAGSSITNATTATVNLPSPRQADAQFSFSLFNKSLSQILGVELSALEADGNGKIVSSPRVVTANNVEATIEDGTEVYFITSTQINSGAQKIDAKLSLKTTPQITPEGRVKMKLLIEKAEPDWSRTVQGFPPIKKSKIETDVVVDNGGTIVIGGVFTTNRSTSTERIPFLGDLPYIGFMFKQNHQDNTRRELLIFITPRVLSENVELR